ncbi:MAG: 2Fe-2S iron-sulfur cluster binding domain-containing protein [Oleispira sp.]|nr:2Fe-2S iron-sulfur cluster binding domain-containing protein [Oleispira sp.]
MNALTQASLPQKGWTWFSQALTQHSSFSGYLQPLIQMLVPLWTTDAYRAQIIEIRDEMADMYTLVLKPQTGLIDRQWPTFVAGQFIELMVEKDGARTLRCFSISSSPAYYDNTGYIELSIRIQQQGRITPWIRQQLARGSLVNISAAQGDFVLPEEMIYSQKPEKLLFIAGGSGITPFRSMLQQQALTQKTQSAEFDIHLLYYSRNNQQIVFQQEFEQLQKEYPSITITFVDSEQDGFICAEHLQAYCSDFLQRTAFICGPSPMIQQARKVLVEQGISKEKINFEFFGAAPVGLENSEQGIVHFQASEKIVISEKDKTSTLLEQAEEQGLSPVSGCRIGVCHQCICKKKSGVVFNTRTQTYSDTGSEEIQLCISVAQGDVVLDL